MTPSAVQLANYLAQLSSVFGLTASTVRVHRAAICTTIRQMGGPLFDADPLLRDLSRGLSLASAMSPRRVPAWDLFLVLVALRLAPFEPLASAELKFLYWKTAFLVSLASARRDSEVHGLSGLARDISWEPDGAVSLRFLPEFLAKNQVPGSPSPTIFIRPLMTILGPDDEDRLLCPVRALRVYLRRSRPLRSPSLRRLFVSYNPSYDEDISKVTLARWISETIKRAYKGHGNYISVIW